MLFELTLLLFSLSAEAICQPNTNQATAASNTTLLLCILVLRTGINP
jgi:hypothetical protein